MKHAKRSKRTWSNSQRLKYKLTMRKKRLARGEAVVGSLSVPSSLTHTPTKLIPRFKSQVPDVDAIWARWKRLSIAGRRFMLGELMRDSANSYGESELG